MEHDDEAHHSDAVSNESDRPAPAPRKPIRTWLRVHEAADYAGLSTDTIYTACERGELRHARVGGRRTIRMRPEWIDAWLEKHARGVA